VGFTRRSITPLKTTRAPSGTTLHVLTRRTPVRVGDRELQLDPGDIITLEPGLVHGAPAHASAFFMIRADARPPAS
jgi:quercetin dioxygenase-like cupin family protein